jgi:rhodanese-related sulfurtransferase
MVKKLLLRDALRIWLLFSFCLIAGVVLNVWRPRPLPLLYVSPEERLAQATQKLAPESAATVASGDDVDLNAMRQIVETRSALIIDARPEIFFRVSHIPAAISLPRDDFEAAYRELGPALQNFRDRPVVVYCSSNGCEDSQMVADSLGRLGFAQVRVYRGGSSEWESQNLPEEKP